MGMSMTVAYRTPAVAAHMSRLHLSGGHMRHRGCMHIIWIKVRISSNWKKEIEKYYSDSIQLPGSSTQVKDVTSIKDALLKCCHLS